MTKITKNPLVIILFIGAVIYGLYYLMSPYQQCLRSITQTSDLYNFSIIKPVLADEEGATIDFSQFKIEKNENKNNYKAIKRYCNKNTSW